MAVEKKLATVHGDPVGIFEVLVHADAHSGFRIGDIDGAGIAKLNLWKVSALVLAEAFDENHAMPTGAELRARDRWDLCRVEGLLKRMGLFECGGCADFSVVGVKFVVVGASEAAEWGHESD